MRSFGFRTVAFALGFRLYTLDLGPGRGRDVMNHEAPLGRHDSLATMTSQPENGTGGFSLHMSGIRGVLLR